jgi:hypothetical protein
MVLNDQGSIEFDDKNWLNEEKRPIRTVRNLGLPIEEELILYEEYRKKYNFA